MTNKQRQAAKENKIVYAYKRKVVGEEEYSYSATNSAAIYNNGSVVSKVRLTNKQTTLLEASRKKRIELMAAERDLIKDFLRCANG